MNSLKNKQDKLRLARN